MTASLACLETVVHLNSGNLPLNRFLVCIAIPDTVWAAKQIYAVSDLPVGWNAIPEGRASLDAGDAWLQAATSALLVVPSVIVPEECNVLMNPAHTQITQVHAKKMRPWFYDKRLR
jgi:RES domain-containing protein